MPQKRTSLKPVPPAAHVAGDGVAALPGRGGTAIFAGSSNGRIGGLGPSNGGSSPLLAAIPSGARAIPLNGGLFALVDEEDFEFLNKWKWIAQSNARRPKPYAVRRGGDGKWIFMHRLIMKPPCRKHVDHINGEGLDNRKSNLRCCSLSQNAANRAKPARPTKFPFKGIYAKGERFGAKIRVKGKVFYHGIHDTIEKAARAYDKAAKKRFGKFAALNFPAEAVS